MAIDLFALLAVHPVLHPVGVIGLALGLYGKGDLPSRAFAMVGRGRILHAAMLLGTVPALEQFSFEVHPDLSVLRFPLASQGETLASWADTGQLHRIELELTGRDGVLPALIREVLMPFAVLVLLVLELRVPAAELVVRHVAVDPVLVQVLHVGFVGETGVSGDHRALLVDTLGDTQPFIAGVHALQYTVAGCGVPGLPRRPGRR